MKLKIWAVAIMMGLGMLPLALQAASVPTGPHVLTSGTASVEAVPDIVVLSIEVNASSKEVVEAKKQVDDRMVKYFNFLKTQGIEQKDINAANLRTQPEYDYDKKGGGSVLKGYLAVRQIQVTLRQLDKLNSLLDEALKLGLHDIRGIELGVANPDIYREQARQKAIEHAIQQAEILAKGFKASLGPIFSISYHVVDQRPMPVPRLYSAALQSNDGVVAQTYEQKTIRFDDQVEVVFELKP